MRIMRVKLRSHKFVLHKFFIAPYVTMHKFLMRIKMSLYGIFYALQVMTQDYYMNNDCLKNIFHAHLK